MTKKLSAVEIMYHTSSYRHLGYVTNYECELATSYAAQKFEQDEYEKQLFLHSQDSEITALIHKRKSQRAFSGDSISNQELLHLLFNAYSLKSDTGSFTVPQAGGLNVMSLYVLVNKKLHWEAYRYDSNKYLMIKSSGFPIKIGSLLYTKSVSFESASHCIVIASDLKAFSQVYLARAYKFACFQAGHIAQNLLLTAMAKKIHGVTLGSLIEHEIKKSCEFSEHEYPLYAVILGK